MTSSVLAQPEPPAGGLDKLKHVRTGLPDNTSLYGGWLSVWLSRWLFLACVSQFREERGNRCANASLASEAVTPRGHLPYAKRIASSATFGPPVAATVSSPDLQ